MCICNICYMLYLSLSLSFYIYIYIQYIIHIYNIHKKNVCVAPSSQFSALLQQPIWWVATYHSVNSACSASQRTHLVVFK